jgi:hypothetical protein
VPASDSPAVTAQIEELRRTLNLGPARIAYRLGVPASTVHRVLVRLGLNRLAWMDRPTGRVIRRYERDRPGDLIHLDIKKLGRIPDGGGHKVLGRIELGPDAQAGLRQSRPAADAGLRLPPRLRHPTGQHRAGFDDPYSARAHMAVPRTLDSASRSGSHQTPGGWRVWSRRDGPR